MVVGEEGLERRIVLGEMRIEVGFGQMKPRCLKE